MRIGLLEAETLAPAIAEQYGSYGDMFVKLLTPHIPHGQFEYYAVDQQQLPPHIHQCDAYILTGSRHNAYDNEPWNLALQNFIRQLEQARIPILGICFGHQIIARALGGHVAKSNEGWGIGVARFNLATPLPWDGDNTSPFDILVSHQDQVTGLPARASLFAESDFCPIGGFFIDRHVFCLQGHPEFTPDYLHYLISKREGSIGSEKVAKALNSLALFQPDPRLIHWIIAFLKQAEA